jgi:hypothetical protein
MKKKKKKFKFEWRNVMEWSLMWWIDWCEKYDD